MTNGLSLEELMKEGTYPEEYTEGENWKILHGDTLKLVKAFQPGIFDAVITDPPYASGGTKQNERNRTTNQKYSSMSAANALPDFDGDNKDQRSWTHWMAEWLYDVRKACKKGAPICLFIDWRQYPSITDALQWAGDFSSTVGFWEAVVTSVIYFFFVASDASRTSLDISTKKQNFFHTRLHYLRLCILTLFKKFLYPPSLDFVFFFQFIINTVLFRQFV